MAPASTTAICLVTMSRAEGFSECPLSGRLLQRTKIQNIGHSTVMLDQEQKEEQLYEVFEEDGDKPIPES